MSFMTWIKDKFNKFVQVFEDFLKELFTSATKALLGEFKDFAISVITKLSSTDLSSESKRIEAFKEIKAEAIRRGKALPDSLINLLIELAVAKIKKETA